MTLEKQLIEFRKWQVENWKDVYLYADSFMIETYLKDRSEALNMHVVSKSLPTDKDQLLEVNRMIKDWGLDSGIDIQSFGFGFKTGVLWENKRDIK